MVKDIRGPEKASQDYIDQSFNAQPDFTWKISVINFHIWRSLGGGLDKYCNLLRNIQVECYLKDDPFPLKFFTIVVQDENAPVGAVGMWELLRHNSHNWMCWASRNLGYIHMSKSE